MPWPKGVHRSEQDRQKMREGHARNPLSDEKRKQMSESRKGRRHTEEAKSKMSASKLGNHDTLGMKRSEEDRANISRRLLGNQHSKGVKHSEETRARHKAVALQNFRGGKIADDYARILCPVGYVRERHVMWGDGCNDRFRLDFAHIEAMVNIELDGPSHKITAEQDALRDKMLRLLGWRVIRIKV